MIGTILTASHNAARRGVLLMSMGILNAVLNAVFDVGLGVLFGVGGIALSTALTVGIVQFLNAWRLGTLDTTFPLGAAMTVSAKALAASVAVAIPIGVIAWNVPLGLGAVANFMILSVLTIVGMIGYVIVSRAIGLVEPTLLVVRLGTMTAQRIGGRIK